MRAAWWWIDRWRNSTAYTDMTAEEQGLYRNLLDEVWMRPEHVIPDDPRVLARVSGDHEAWKRSGAKVLLWMKKIPGGWTHDVALEVIKQSTRRAENQRKYRNKRDNGIDNAGDNGLDNPTPNDPDSLSKSLSLTDNGNGARSAGSLSDSFPSQVSVENDPLPSSSGLQPVPEEQRPEYSEAVWELFLDRLGEKASTRLMSRTEFELVKRWMDAGTPLRVVLQAIGQPRTPGRVLAYYEGAVRDEFERQQLAVGGTR